MKCLVSVLLACSLLTSCTKKESDNVLALHLELKETIKGLDPATANDVYGGRVVMCMYESLFQYNYLKRPLTLEPLLAQGMPEISSDGLTHTIKIKSGVKFQDDPAFPGGKGREMVAEDFIYSWKRIADTAVQSDGFWIFDGKIKGLNEWRIKMQKGEATYDTPVEGLSAPDNTTLVIKLTRPYFQLEYVLAHAYSSVVPKEAVAKYGKELINHPVGTGPFQLESWTRNAKIQMKRNPTWHGGNYPTEGESTDATDGLLADAGKPLPFVEKLTFYEMPEDQTRWLNFMKGNLDQVSIPKDNYDNAVKDKVLMPDLQKKGFKLSINHELDVTYVGFNMDDPILGKHANLRRAIALAIDHKTFIEKFYNNRAIQAESLIPPDIEGYDPDYKSPYQYNLDKAKQMLAKAGYPGGKGLPTFEYSAPSSSTSRQIAEYFQQQMAAIGIQVRIVTSSWPQFTEKLRSRKAQIWGMAWMGDYPDAENFLQLLYGPNASPGSNSTNYRSKAFDALYDKAAHLRPGVERTKVYRQMRDIIAEDVPMIVEAHRTGYYLQQGWLGNFKLNQTILNFAKYLKMDPAIKADLKPKL